ncbi:peptide deformylase, partial [Streptococcus thermophilus]
MIKTIVKDVFFLGQKSTEATKEDLYLAKDLRDTLEFHKDTCVGMAANMIGVKKRVI